ncbi:MAG: hypothetical protein P8K70_03370, partial [Flavobacteriaceae bacterium]|nr:hypothetical protein [Flavobacteriaceae bacterium]
MEEFIKEHTGTIILVVLFLAVFIPGGLIILVVLFLVLLIRGLILVIVGDYFENKAYKRPNYLDNLRLLKEFLERTDSLNNYVNWVEKQQIETAYYSVGKFFRNKTRSYKKEPDVKKFNERY